MPRLRILAGSSPSTAVVVSANDGVAHRIQNEYFEGQVCIFIRYEDELGAAKTSRPASRASNRSNRSASPSEDALRNPAAQYFDSPERRGVTWSVQIQGRFLQPISSDDVLFGNTFERPLKLPWGSGAALKFMNFIDPTLEHDLGGQKPWALSPLVSTMPYLAHTKHGANSALPQFPSPSPLTDACATLIPDGHAKSRSPSPSRSSANASTRLSVSRDHSPSANPISPASSKRRSIFSSQATRRATTLGPDDLITADFCYGFLSFPSITLKLPGGISFDCLKYWDRQPVTFACCRRAANGKGPGEPFWCVMFEVIDDGDEAEAPLVHEDSEVEDIACRLYCATNPSL